MKEYITIAQESQSEYIIEKSKFIGTVVPCRTVEEAQAIIATIQKQNWNATHNCTAFCLGPNQEQQRSSDDGEPSGTAGKPILEALKKKNITDAVIIITRYFGGVKLGAGGLIRAYSHIANQTLEEAPKELVAPRQLVTIDISYALFTPIELFLQEKGLHFEKEFGASVQLTVFVPPDDLESLHDEIINRTNGSALWHEGDVQEVRLPYTAE